MVSTVAMADPYLSVWDIETPEGNVANSWIGSTGMVMTPTARTCAPQGIIGSYHWIDTDPDSWDVWSVNVGITNNIEIGASKFSDAFGGTQSETVGNIKVNLDMPRWTNNTEAPEMAVGVFDFSDQLNRAYYVVLTKEIELKEEGTISNFRLNLGYADNEVDAGALDGIFGGIEFSPFDHALVQAEYDGSDVNATVRYHPSEWMSLELASINGDLGVGLNVHTGF
jgi:hypothetical protein